MEIFSPTRGVTNPRATRPTVIPSQNPVAVIPLANAGPCRTRVMKVTIHPPSATSIPTYPSRKKAQSQVTRADGLRNSACRRPPLSFPSCDRAVVCRNVAPVDFQKVAVQVATSTAAHAIYGVQHQRSVRTTSNSAWGKHTMI